MMNKHFVINRLLAVWVAISSVLIIAGAVLFGLFGFNHAKSEYQTFEVTYSAVVSINDKEEDLASICETAFKANGVSYEKKETCDSLNSSNFASTGEKVLRYTLSGKVSENALSAVRTAVKAKLAESELYANVATDYHTFEGTIYYEQAWRGAIGIAVGVVIALIYGAIRFGLSAALTGLVAAVHDVALSLALLALFRIPVSAYTPVVFAGIAAFLSVLLWFIESVKLREEFKAPSPAPRTVDEVVETCHKNSSKTVLIIAGVIAFSFVVLGALGALASIKVLMFMLGALIPLAVSTYSSLVFSVAVFTPIRAGFERSKEKRNRPRYSGKQKAEKAE